MYKMSVVVVSSSTLWYLAIIIDFQTSFIAIIVYIKYIFVFSFFHMKISQDDAILKFVSTHTWKCYAEFSDLNIDLYGSSLSHIHHFNCHDQTKDENFLFHGQKQNRRRQAQHRKTFFACSKMKKWNKIKF